MQYIKLKEIIHTILWEKILNSNIQFFENIMFLNIFSQSILNVVSSVSYYWQACTTSMNQT